MKYFTLLITLFSLNVASFACPAGECHDKDCREAKVHTTGIGGGVTRESVKIHMHGKEHVHGHDAEHAAEQAKFRLPPPPTKTTPKTKAD